jgi:two-component system heavy metal sensor histidine kinase CusS
MIKSFRLRLALLTLLLAGIALSAFAASTWWLINKLQNERLDTEIRTYTERVAGRLRQGVDWPGPIKRIGDEMHIQNPQDLILLQQDVAGETVFQSDNWPLQLLPNALPWPADSTLAAAQRLNSSAGQTFWPTEQGLLMASVWRNLYSGFAYTGSSPTPTSCSPGQHSSRNAGQRGPANAQRAKKTLQGTQTDNIPAKKTPPRSAYAPLSPPTQRSPAADPSPIRIQTPASNNADRPLNEGSAHLHPNLATKPQLNAPPSITGALPSATLQPPVSPSVDFQTPANASANAPLSPNSPPPSTDSERPMPVAHPLPRALASLTSRTIDGQKWRIGMVTTAFGRIALGVNTRVLDSEMRGIRNAFLAALPFALLFIGLGSWLVASRAIRPLRTLTHAAHNVTAEGLYQRIAVRGEDREFVEVIEMFNGMLERLERSFKQAHRFSTDAAHELQTPLTILQGQLERAINSVDDGAPIQATLADILDEVRRLSGISRKLLLLSQADAGRLRIQSQPFELSRALNELLEDAHMLAPHLQVTGLIPSGITIPADASLLRQALHNLLSNAIKYNLNDGWVRISVQIKTDDIVIRLSNSAADIPEKERSKLFERFFRVDSSHSRSIDGTGLGLSLSKEIAKAHGGDLFFVNSAQGSVTFSLRLPK